MLVLVPPSETKRSGGEQPSLNIRNLSFSELSVARTQVIDALVALSGDTDVAVRVLKLGAKSRAEVADNLSVLTSPTMMAIDRYDGVLFAALDPESLPVPARNWVEGNIAIQSAAFGLIRASDAIPKYRLSAGSPLPGLTTSGSTTVTLRKLWQQAHADMAQHMAASEFILDLRSKDYQALAPFEGHDNSAWVNVLSRDASGAVRALNHFNKTAKGQLLRLMAEDRVECATIDEFLDWTTSRHIEAHHDAPQLVSIFADSIRLDLI